MINALAEFLYVELVNDLNSPINSSLALIFWDVCNKHCPWRMMSLSRLIVLSKFFLDINVDRYGIELS